MKDNDVFLVDSYDISVEVRPLAKSDLPVRYGSKTRVIHTDNIAHMSRTVKFAASNTCTCPYTLRYATRGDGFITEPVLIPGPNEAPPADLGRYLDGGKEVTYCFTPKAEGSYTMNFSILKGSDPGDRNLHFHLHRQTRYETIVVTLDLAPYLEQGYPLTRLPELRFHQDDPQDHDLCKLRGPGATLNPVHVGRGRWRWQMQRVHQGVIDVIWGVDGPEKAIAETAPETMIREALIRKNLTACQVFQLLLKIVHRWGSVSFRGVRDKAGGLVPAVGFGSDLPLSQSQISRLMPEVETMLADPAFFGEPVFLFSRTPGKASVPSDKARAALRMIKPFLDKIAAEEARKSQREIK